MIFRVYSPPERNWPNPLAVGWTGSKYLRASTAKGFSGRSGSDDAHPDLNSRGSYEAEEEEAITMECVTKR